MLRRQFIHRATISMIGAAVSALPELVFAVATSWKASFAAALEKTPWLLAFRTASADAFQADATVTGQIPQDLQGTLYRNGPARHEIGDFRYHHWFDGEWMIQAWHLGAIRSETHHKSGGGGERPAGSGLSWANSG